MDGSISSGALLGVGLALAASLAWGQPPPLETPPFVPGQVIVKFTAEGSGGRALAQADRDDLETDTGLTHYLAVLSRDVAVPLRIERLSSGDELLLAIDLEALRSELLTHLRGDPRVESAEEREVTPEAGLDEAGSEALVQFIAGSEAAATVRTSHAEGLETSPECQALARDLLGDLGHQPVTRIAGDSELVLGIDVRELTKELAARLRERPDIEYAQLNILLQTFG